MRKGYELVALSFVELVLELYPMKSQVMQEAFHYVHKHEYKRGDACKDKERDGHL